MLTRSDLRTKGSVAIKIDSLHTELLDTYGSGKTVVGIELGFVETAKGTLVGRIDGIELCTRVGGSDFLVEGCTLAAPLGGRLAVVDGVLLKASLGLADDIFEGQAEGRAEAAITGFEDGKFEDEVEGEPLAVTDGVEDAFAVGTSDLVTEGG